MKYQSSRDLLIGAAEDADEWARLWRRSTTVFKEDREARAAMFDKQAANYREAAAKLHEIEQSETSHG